MDNPCGFSADQFLHALKTYGPELSAHEVASLAKVSIRQVLCCQHHAPWEIEAITGDYPGFKYRKRIVLSARGKVVKEVQEYVDVGISKRSPKAVANE